MTKREYLAANQHRITCDSDNETLWDAYNGSDMLFQRIWDLYEKKGRALGVRPEVAGLMLMNGGGLAGAKAAIG